MTPEDTITVGPTGQIKINGQAETGVAARIEHAVSSLSLEQLVLTERVMPVAVSVLQTGRRMGLTLSQIGAVWTLLGEAFNDKR